MKKVSVFSLCIILVASAALAVEMSSMKVGTPEEAMMQKQAQQQLHARLIAEQVELGVKSSIVVNLNDDQRKSLTTGSLWPYQVGVVAPVAVDISFDIGSPKAITDAVMPVAYGAISRHGKRMVWTTSVVAEKATGIRLFITGLDLPKSVELAIYNQRGEAFAYTGKGPSDNGDFWTNTVTGSVAYLQLTGADLTQVSFSVADLGYLGPRWVFGAHTGFAKAHCSYNESCVENAGCGIDPPASDMTNAVAYMLWVKNPYIYTCSGSLLANNSGKDYFLTANHCISRTRDASTLEAYFFYEIGCNDPCPEEWSEPSTPRVLGATVAATNKTSDYTILELSEPAPSGSVRLGWDSTDIAFAHGTNMYRISHPSTAPQGYSTHMVDTGYGTCGAWPRGNWIYSRDTYGATEGGSSGSPVVNSSGLVVGQLSGGCGTNLGDVCDSESNATVDGSFAAYYDDVASLLGGTTCPDADDDGYTDAACGGSDCDDSDPNVNPGAIEDCYNGIDDDCDGAIDGDDPDCGSCLPAGSSCTSNSDCCSNKCVGRPGGKTCK